VPNVDQSTLKCHVEVSIITAVCANFFVTLLKPVLVDVHGCLNLPLPLGHRPTVYNSYSWKIKYMHSTCIVYVEATLTALKV
jgi:hypothetical protein